LVANDDPARGDAPGPSAEHKLLRQVEASLARIVSHQLLSVTPEGEPTGAWYIEIPLREGFDDEPLALSVTRRSRGETSADAVSATLRVPLGEHGRLIAHLRIHGNDVSATLSADRLETLQLIEQRRGELSERFESAGLHPVLVNCAPGLPDASPRWPDPGLLDVVI
jgi:hypothetical protein